MAKTDPKIRFIGGYRYQLVSGYAVQIDIKPPRDIVSDYIKLTTDGYLMIAVGYCWDGPSGPTIDTKSFMRGSLIHDALNQLLRNGLLDAACRQAADLELHTACRADGMAYVRAQYVYRSVRWFGASSANPENKKVVQVAP